MGPAEEARRRAARALVRLIEELGRKSTTLMALATGGRRARRFKPLPDPPVYDRRTRSLLVYHHHGGEPAWPGEAGHFHAVRVLRRRPRSEHVSLVAVAMSRRGWPRALFTVNLWAWQERSRTARELRRHLRHFHIRPAGRHARLARFANLVVEAWRPEIERLQTDKLRRLACLARRRRRGAVARDQSIDVLSAVPIDARARAAGRSAPRRATGAEHRFDRHPQ